MAEKDSKNNIFSIKLERDELQEQLGGGLPRGAICYIEGEFGSGKSAIVQRFTYGLLEAGYSVSYISTELTVKDFINQMYSLNFPIATPLLNHQLLYIPVYPLIGSVGKRKIFLSKLLRARGIFESEVIIIDTFSSLLKASLNEDNKGIKTLSFLKKITGMDKTVILTSDPHDLPDNVQSIFKDSSHVYISIMMKTLGGELTRTLKVNRYLGTPKKPEDMVGFKVIPGIGIIIEITEVG